MSGTPNQLFQLLTFWLITPYILADGGLWLWGEVATALADRGEEVEEIGYPDRRDIQVIGGVLAANVIAAEVGVDLSPQRDSRWLND